MNKLITIIAFLFFVSPTWGYVVEPGPEPTELMQHSSQSGWPTSSEYSTVRVGFVEISMDGGIVDVKYISGATRTQAAEEFFEFFRKYVEMEYNIIKK